MKWLGEFVYLTAQNGKLILVWPSHKTMVRIQSFMKQKEMGISKESIRIHVRVTNNNDADNDNIKVTATYCHYTE